MATSTQTIQEPRGLVYERPRDVIKRTRLSRSVIYDLLASGQLPVRRCGRSVLVEAGAVDRYLAEQSERQRPSAA